MLGARSVGLSGAGAGEARTAAGADAGCAARVASCDMASMDGCSMVHSIVRGLVRSADIFGAFLQIPLCGILVRETKVVLHWAIIVHSPGETAAVSCPY